MKVRALTIQSMSVSQVLICLSDVTMIALIFIQTKMLIMIVSTQLSVKTAKKIKTIWPDGHAITKAGSDKVVLKESLHRSLVNRCKKKAQKVITR